MLSSKGLISLSRAYQIHINWKFFHGRTFFLCLDIVMIFLYSFCILIISPIWEGMGQGSTDGSDNRDAYLQLSVTVLAAFCRVTEIAASNDMVSKIPLILEILSNK